ncbi:MAG: DUF3800 domain-containing protein [Pirellulales bacterium]|nr:DUF3800 domain-containing protein [Pirellulales bacterium]
MYLLYLDDSGSAKNPNEEYLVLGGVAVFERQVYWLSESLEAIAKTINPTDPDSVEFHASEIAGGRAPPWNTFKKKEDRINIIQSVLKVLAQDTVGTTAFACAVHKKSFPSDDPMERAFEEVCDRFDHYLRRKYQEDNEKARGLIIIDKTAYETTLQGLARDFRRIGTRWRVIKNLADIPLFVDSRASRIVQLADHVAYSVFRRYQAGDTRLLDVILSSFDAEGGKIHGLVHKQNYDSNCMCPACMSRRIT